MAEVTEGLRGYCSSCRTDVVIDGRPGDEEETVWSHLAVEMVPVVAPGHHPSCEGDCRLCPIPVDDVEPQQRECGPVYVRR